MELIIWCRTGSRIRVSELRKLALARQHVPTMGVRKLLPTDYWLRLGLQAWTVLILYAAVSI